MDVTPSHLVALRLSSTAVVSERISGGRKRSAGTGCVFFFHLGFKVVCFFGWKATKPRN